MRKKVLENGLLNEVKNVMKLSSVWVMDCNLSADFIDLLLHFIMVET